MPERGPRCSVPGKVGARNSLRLLKVSECTHSSPSGFILSPGTLNRLVFCLSGQEMDAESGGLRGSSKRGFVPAGGKVAAHAFI